MSGPWSLRCITPWMQKWWRPLSRWGPWSRKPGLEGGLCNQSFNSIGKLYYCCWSTSVPIFFWTTRLLTAQCHSAFAFLWNTLQLWVRLVRRSLRELHSGFKNLQNASNSSFSMDVLGIIPCFDVCLPLDAPSGSTLVRLTGYWRLSNDMRMSLIRWDLIGKRDQVSESQSIILRRRI